MITYTLKVIELKKETKDTITVCFKQPALRKIKYEAGQYLTLIFRINGRRYIRPYSFSSSPLTDTSLDVTIKRVQNGIVSNHIHDTIKVGDSIEVLAPMGDFIYNGKDNSQEQVFLWGVGSGITPLISLTKQILTESSEKKVNLVYGNRNHESVIFNGLIEEYLMKYPSRFKVWHFHTQLSVVGTSFLVQGRITEKSVFSIMEGRGTGQSLHYICGPFGLKESVKSVLHRLGVQETQINSEDFELIKKPEDFENIQTQLINLTFENKQYTLEVIKGKSVLESALDAGIELPYSCQTGNCSTCMASLKSGSLKMIGLKNTREDLSEDEFLLCCSYPLTDNVNLEV